MDDRERRIRDRAYALWERNGRPEGREREHWEAAMREVDAEAGSTAGATADPVAPVPVSGDGESDGRKGGKSTGAKKKPGTVAARKPAAARVTSGGTARKKKSDK